MKTEAQIKETLQNLVGKTVEFTPKIRFTECSFSEGMRARIVKYDMTEYHENSDESLIKIWFDFGSFANFNRPLQQAVFYDRARIPCLTWEQYAPEEFNSKEDKNYFSNYFMDMFKVVGGISEVDAELKIAKLLREVPAGTSKAAEFIVNNRKEILAILNEIV